MARVECWTLMNRGYNYRTDEIEEAEHHYSITQAENAFWRWCDDPHNAADDSTEMMVYLYEPDEMGDNMPDFRIFMGPKGGVRRERA